MEQEKTNIKGLVFLTLWFILIWAGIISKRIFGHPDMMVFYHLPAAACLVIALYSLTKKYRRRYAEELRKRIR